MLTEEEVIRYGEQAERIFSNLEQSIIDDIVRRIRKAGEITETADYQIKRLHELGLSSEEIKDAIQGALKATESEIERIFQEAGQKDYFENKALYEGLGLPFKRFEDNSLVQNIVNAARWQTMGEMENLTQTIGFITAENRFLPIREYFTRKLDTAVGQIISGAFDYNTILKKTVSELVNSGMRWVDYESGHHNRVNVSVRRAVMTGIRQMTQGITLQTAQELGTDKFQVTAHPNARPSHAIWQGKIYTKKGLISKCGLGTGDGLLGWNCYHNYYPYIPGISKRKYTPAQLKEWRETSTEKRYEWQGKKLTGYQGTQLMRQYEHGMRLQRERIHLLKLGGADPEEIKKARARYYANRARYKELANTLNLHTQFERVTVDGLGRV